MSKYLQLFLFFLKFYSTTFFMSKIINRFLPFMSCIMNTFLLKNKKKIKMSGDGFERIG